MADFGVPKGLGARGKALWRAATADFELSTSDGIMLEQACAQLDNIAALEALLAEQGLLVEGSTGRQRLNPVVAEIRQGRLAFGKLIDALAWPLDEGDEGATPAARRAAKAANARWGRVRLIEDKRAGHPNAAS